MSQLVDTTALLILVAAALAALVGWAVGGDRDDAERVGTRPCGVAELVDDAPHGSQ